MNMKKYILPVILSIGFGLFLTKFILNQYNNGLKLIPVNTDINEKLYFIQQGVYSNLESMEKNTKDFDFYSYSVINDKYYVYIGITKKEENISKIQGYYKNMGYITVVKEFNTNNGEFIELLDKYDELLYKTDDPKSIGTICNQILKKYNERNDKI